ncbi:hypothetical protein CBL_21130 [Carabus blaptoides fortunei]
MALTVAACLLIVLKAHKTIDKRECQRVLDELLTDLNNSGTGGIVAPGTRISALSFADDIVLLEDQDIDMSISLETCVRIMRARGMTLNAKKSSVSEVSVPRSKCTFRIQGPSYQCGRLRERAPLKPSQKLILLKQHLIPRLFYGLQVSSVTAKILSVVDRLIRRTVKKTLHLSKHTGDQFIHTAIRDGGLGIPKMRRIIPAIMRDRITALIMQDPTTSALSTVEPTASLFERITRLSQPGNPDAFWREQISTRPFSAGLEEASEDVASRSWVYNAPPGCTTPLPGGRDETMCESCSCAPAIYHAGDYREIRPGMIN